VVHDDNLSLEGGNTGSGTGFGVRGNVSTTKILDGNVLHVETNVVTRYGLGKGFVVHFDRLDFSNNLGRSKGGMDTRFDDTSFYTTNGHSSDTSNFVNILKGKTKGLLGGTLGWLAVIKGLKKVGSLVPSHVGGSVNHVVSLPTGDGDERNLHWLVTNLFEVSRNFGLDFLITLLVVFDGLVVHLITGNDHLLDSKSVSEESVLTSLSVLGDTGFETTLRRVDDENSNIGLRGSGDHVLNEITVSGCINDGERELGRLELPEGDIDGDSALTLGFEVVKNPGVFEGSLSEFGGFLFELFDGTLIDTSAFVDQVTSGGGLTGIDVSNNN
jgi:hypothetical protein